VLIVAAMTVVQGRLLEGQDPVAMTAVQFLGAALAALPAVLLTRPVPPALPHGGAGVVAVLAVVGLAVVGTLVPFTLFAYGQHAVSTEVAGAFLNLEPLVGAMVGVVAFGDPAGPRLAIGGAAILGGILMSSVPALRGHGHGDGRGHDRGRGRPRLATAG
jgi:O-acetylserine/cysteine efflux transporter